MTSRFIVAAEPLTKDQEQQFREFVTANSGTWRHWINNFWLLKFDSEKEVTANMLWGELAKLNPSARIFITEESQTDWTITDSETPSGKKMSTWLETHWMD